MTRRRGALFAALLLLAGCTGVAPPPQAVVAPPLAPVPPLAVAPAPTVVRLAPPLATQPGWLASDPAPALAAFRTSCPKLQARSDGSGLTEPGDWAAICAAAAAATDARAFFETALVPVIVATGSGVVTGYYEPELAGSQTASADFAVPFYRRPPDLIEADLGGFGADLKGRKLRGRVDGTALVPYYDRAAIDAGALAGRGLELAWAADPYEAFFLEIQGSGRLRLPSGAVMRIGYAGQNGHAYTAIGRLLRERGLLAAPVTMDGILAWLRANPPAARALLQENRSYVFFREVTGDGPFGALGVALTPGASVAADPGFVPLGAPLWLATSTADGGFARLLVAQDTGGAIKGANRFDIFFGAGPDARRLAGAQSATGAAILLLPRVAALRLTSPDRSSRAAPPRP